MKDFTSTVMKGTTKIVAGKAVLKSARAVRYHVVRNSLQALAETASISFGAWINAMRWGALRR